jgi:hypothetical protein
MVAVGIVGSNTSTFGPKSGELTEVTPSAASASDPASGSAVLPVPPLPPASPVPPPSVEAPEPLTLALPALAPLAETPVPAPLPPWGELGELEQALTARAIRDKKVAANELGEIPVKDMTASVRDSHLCHTGTVFARGSNMWVEAILLKEELSLLVGQFTPVTIGLGDDGALHIHDPSDITLVPDVGLRVVCKANLRWAVLGIAVPMTINSLVVLVRPAIAKREGIDALVFKLEIEHIDLALLPKGIDDRVTHLVNRELDAKHVELSWDYAATLNHVFTVPGILHPIERLELTVRGARVTTTGEVMGLAIAFGADVRRA